MKKRILSRLFLICHNRLHWCKAEWSGRKQANTFSHIKKRSEKSLRFFDYYASSEISPLNLHRYTGLRSSSHGLLYRSVQSRTWDINSLPEGFQMRPWDPAVQFLPNALHKPIIPPSADPRFLFSDGPVIRRRLRLSLCASSLGSIAWSGSYCRSTCHLRMPRKSPHGPKQG